MSQSIRVLCIDDNRLLADAIERRLSFEPGCEWAGWVADTAEAGESVRRTRPDVVLFDIDMPGRDCFEIVRELAAAHPDLRIVMFSGHIRPDYIDRAVEAGAWGYLSKNEGIDEVMTAIRRVTDGEFVLTPDVQSVRNTES